jgi:hypothetical protein
VTLRLCKPAVARAGTDSPADRETTIPIESEVFPSRERSVIWPDFGRITPRNIGQRCAPVSIVLPCQNTYTQVESTRDTVYGSGGSRPACGQRWRFRVTDAEFMGGRGGTSVEGSSAVFAVAVAQDGQDGQGGIGYVGAAHALQGEAGQGCGRTARAAAGGRATRFGPAADDDHARPEGPGSVLHPGRGLPRVPWRL